MAQSDSMSSRNNPPPPPPPPENLSSKTSPVVLKLRSISPNKFFHSRDSQTRTPGPPTTGRYFFYGSLQDPSLLIDILNLEFPPVLRSAYIDGYRCKLWGHYPALLHGIPDERVKGVVFEVQTIDQAQRLADYEGPSYVAIPCKPLYTDVEPSSKTDGHVFLFVGNLNDLSEGSYDLDNWLKRRVLTSRRN